MVTARLKGAVYEVLDTFWYGAATHAHPKARRTLARRKKDEILNFAVRFKLVDTLWKIFIVIQEVSKINGKAIEELERGGEWRH